MRMEAGGEHGTVEWSGELHVPDVTELERAIKAGWLHDGIDGWDARVISPGRVLLSPLPNLVVNSGINMRLDRLFSISGPPAAVSKMGVDNGASNPVAGTDSSGANTKTIIGFDSTATRASQVVTCIGTFDQSEVNFIMKRLFLSNNSANLTNSTTPDTAGSLHSMTNVFTIDLTGFAAWAQTFTATVTGTGS